MASLASYLGSELYVTDASAEKPKTSDKIKYWESVTGMGSFSKDLIEGEVCDGDGYSYFTTGKRQQEQTVITVHRMDEASITKLDTFARAIGSGENCKIWFKPTAITGMETRAFCANAIISAVAENDANTSNKQGAQYTFAKSGALKEWDGTTQA